MLLWTLAVAAVSAAPALKYFDGYDSTGEGLLLRALDPKEPTVQQAFISPNATKFTLNLECAPGQQLYVDGVKRKPGDFTFKKDGSRHRQVVEVVCEDRSVASSSGLPDRQKNVFLVSANYPVSEIPMPDLLLNEIGIECESNSQTKKINCPDPKLEDKMATVTPAKLKGDIMYTLHTSDNSVNLRLLDGKKSLPFKYNHSYYLTANAGTESVTWPVSFGGSFGSSLLYLVGAFIGLSLLLLVLAMLLVVGGAEVFGLGRPLGTTEIASMLALVIQFFTFGNKLRGSAPMESLATPTKWVSLFWPAPQITNSFNYSRVATDFGGGASHQPVFSKGYGLRLWGDSVMGDVTDVRNAWGCLFWALAFLIALCLLHAAILGGMAQRKNDLFTIPHRMKFGNWEHRALNLLCFPLAMAGTLCILHPQSTVLWAVAGGAVLVGLAIWVLGALAAVASAVRSGEVTWVWEHSVRETGPTRKRELEGYWSDLECDQLLTQPVNRGLLGNCFEYRWVSTVADIKPTTISAYETTSSRHSYSSSAEESGLNPVPKLKKAHRVAGYPLAKNPQVVLVEQARKPCVCFRGDSLVAGVLRTKWLDILFTYEGLTKFLEADQAETPVPLLVKTHQLAGPITNGANAFFFDGARVPFIRVAETLWKLAMGVLLGVACTAEADRTGTVCYIAVALLSLGMCGYVLGTKPYTRHLDNLTVASTAGVLGAAAAAYTVYTYNHKSCLADLFLLLSTVCATLLALYAVWIITSIVSAVLCPPMDESRFLEKLANCTVIVTTPDHQDDYQMTGYSKYAARDVVAKSTTGRSQSRKFGTFEDLDLNFEHHEIAQACQTGVLPIP
ncbi:putative transmembrane protein [Gregarina niphandrodes]|uniref:Transmembrane protein n=1 Tax=Gregarina niphandrodes TaxID=110365 RepID=A0A023B286_GRENI|nr:putative transmembrane protein [Gregarina niphandrodes]EZG51528.1 putative transmembrane protein [Gregarina niphandrodes]|eukprot:XP_011131966.1 putative transmembrane protein [Gregarina niphandrodes]